MPARRSLVAKILVGGTAAVAIAGIGFAWQLQHTLSSHPGEDVLDRYIPENAAIAVSLDLKPRSFEQGQVLQRIDAMLTRENLKSRIADGFHRLSQQTPFVQDMLPHLTGNGAMGIWRKHGTTLDSENIGAVIALTVDSPSATEAILKKYAERTLNLYGTPTYILRDFAGSSNSSPGYFTLRQNYLLLTDSEESLDRIHRVETHQTASLAANTEYRAVRTSLPKEANLVSYVSAAYMRDTQRQTNPNINIAAPTGATAFSATLRQGGIAFDSVIGCQATYAKPLSEIASIDTNTALRIPPKPLAYTVIAQPSKYLETIEGALEATGGDVYASYQKARTEFERETSLSVHTDIFPAFQGQWILAAYPGSKSDTIDLLLLADSSHGATPARLAETARAILERRESRLRIPKRTNGTVTRWSLPADWHIGSLGVDAHDNSSEPKELAAGIDDSFLLATSTDLLNRSLTAYNHPMRPDLDLSRIPHGTKSLTVLETREIIDMLRPHFDAWQRQQKSDTPLTMTDIESLFGTTPLIATVGYENQQLNSSLVLPLHYDTAVHIARVVWDEADNAYSTSPGAVPR